MTYWASCKWSWFWITYCVSRLGVCKVLSVHDWYWMGVMNVIMPFRRLWLFWYHWYLDILVNLIFWKNLKSFAAHSLTHWMLATTAPICFGRFGVMMANKSPPWDAIRALIAGRLLAIDECPGIRPIGNWWNLAASNHQMHSSRSGEGGRKKPKRPVELTSFALA
jgi:hypothetical protein